MLGDADRHRDAPSCREGGHLHLLYHASQAPGGGERGLQPRLRQHDQEFFSAPAAQAVGRPQRALRSGREGLEYFVAARVPVGVIDRLEMIDIHHADRQCTAALYALGLDLQLDERLPAVAAAGERIRGGEDFRVAQRGGEFVVGPAQLRAQAAVVAAEDGEPRQQQREHEQLEQLSRQVERRLHPTSTESAIVAA